MEDTTQVPQAAGAPEGLDEFLAAPAPGSPGAAPEGLDEFIATEMKAEKYGTVGQQLITGAEGAANAATFGLAAGAEKALGVDPEDMRARQEENPGSYLTGQVAGIVGSSFIPVAGAANLAGHAGQAVAGAVGLGAKGAGFVSQVGAAAVKGAFENALFQGGEEVAKAFREDPNQSAESAIADLGMATVLGGVFSGGLSAGVQALGKLAGKTQEGAVKLMGQTENLASKAESAPEGAFISEMDRPAFEAGDFKATIENSDVFTPKEREGILAQLTAERPDAPEIRKAAERLGIQPLEGMVTGSKVVQKAEDALINGAPTYSGLKRQALYNDVYSAATRATEEALGEGSTLTKAELGNQFKQTLVAQLKDENAPIKQLYEGIKSRTETIPLDERIAPRVAQEINSIPELRIAPSSPEGQLLKRVQNEIEALKTVDDVKVYKSTLNYDPASSPNTNRIRAILRDKLNDLEEGSIEGFARSSAVLPDERVAVEGIIKNRQEASKMYRNFMEKVGTLSKQLGKGRIHGPQDAINFIDNLPPETVSNRLFSKNNSEFLNFFQKNFPEQMEQMRSYQKSALKEAATKADTGFSAKDFFNRLNKLEPEIQNSLFTKAELAKIADSETVIRSIPKNFNPSGTSHTTAFRAFFEHPTGAIVANARDVGIDQFIKFFGKSSEASKAASLGKATVSGAQAAEKATSAVFDSSKPSNIKTPSESERSKLSKLVDKFTGDPASLVEIGDNNPIPEYATAFAASAGRVVQYLSTQKPSTAPQAPMDPKPTVSPMQEAAYNRTLNIAQQPLVVMKHMKAGTLTSKDVLDLHAMYPALAKKLQTQLFNKMADDKSKKKPVPFATKQSMSLFLAQPMDSSFKQQNILAAQPKPPQGQEQAAQTAPKGRPSAPSLQKMPSMYQTPEQARAQHKLKQ